MIGRRNDYKSADMNCAVEFTACMGRFPGAEGQLTQVRQFSRLLTHSTLHCDSSAKERLSES